MDTADDSHFDLIELDLPCKLCKRVRPLDENETCRSCAIPPAAGGMVSVEVDTKSGDWMTALAAGSSANAAVTGIGSIAGGQLGGVGFTSRDGYIQALRNGVPETTYQSYVQILRSRYGMTSADINALALPGPMVVPAGPVGVATIHRPTGPSVFDSPAAQRQFIVGPRTVQEQEEQPKLSMTSKDLILGFEATASHVVIAWSGTSKTTRGELVAALTTIDREKWAPSATEARGAMGWLVPKRHAASATELAEAICPVFGEGWHTGMPVTDGPQLRDGLARGLRDEVSQLLHRMGQERAMRDEEHAKAVAQHVAAVAAGFQPPAPRSTGDIGPERAQTYLKELRAIGARVVAWGQVLDEQLFVDCRESVRLAIVQMESLRGEDFQGISARFDAVWDEIEHDRAKNGGVL